ncbi:MAG: hypothetical protein AAF598_16020, partial [Bacteroidota bacterium]
MATDHQKRRGINPGTLITCLLLLISFSVGQAQENAFLAIDQYTTKSAPKATAQNLDQLVNHLVKPAKTDREKARSFFSWIAHNIAYDTHYFYNKDTAEPCFSTD